MKRTFFGDVSSRRSCRSSKNCSTSASSVLLVGAVDLDYRDIEWFVLDTNRDHSVILEITFWTILLTMMAASFLLMDSCPQ